MTTYHLGAAMQAASDIIASGSVTTGFGVEHDTAVRTRYEAALTVVEKAMHRYPVALDDQLYLRAAEKRSLYRECLAAIAARAVAPVARVLGDDD